MGNVHGLGASRADGSSSNPKLNLSGFSTRSCVLFSV